MHVRAMGCNPVYQRPHTTIADKILFIHYLYTPMDRSMKNTVDSLKVAINKKAGAPSKEDW